MKKLGLLVVVVAVCMAFAMPAFAEGCGKCSTCSKPCATPCPKPCVTCTTPCNSFFQQVADWINCSPCAQPCPKPCNTCPKPCSSCSK